VKDILRPIVGVLGSFCCKSSWPYLQYCEYTYRIGRNMNGGSPKLLHIQLLEFQMPSLGFNAWKAIKSQ